MLNINIKFLHDNSYTDIITFNLSSDSTVIGECYISIDRVKDNCNLLNTTFEEELLRVIFHGALHLCGYGDKSEAEIQQMRSLEDKYLLRFNLP